jgi:broad specificity phosphatase PhoE
LDTQIIYFVRHGETEWNREGRVQGHFDAPLTEQGVEQARCAGLILRELLAQEQPYRMRISPLGRARRSAELILEGVGNLVADERVDEQLIEVSWGRWNGLTRAEIEAREPKEWQAREADRWNVPPPGGESHAMLAERVREWLESVREEPRLIVVGHGAWGRALRGTYLQMPPEQLMTLDEPQNAIFRLAAGTVARIPTC